MTKQRRRHYSSSCRQAAYRKPPTHSTPYTSNGQIQLQKSLTHTLSSQLFNFAALSPTPKILKAPFKEKNQLTKSRTLLLLTHTSQPSLYNFVDGHFIYVVICMSIQGISQYRGLCQYRGFVNIGVCPPIYEVCPGLICLI